MVVHESRELSSWLRQKHHEHFGDPPSGITLVVSEFDLVYVLYDSNDSRLNDRPKMEFENHQVRCLAAMMLCRAMDEMAKWCHEKADWYDHVVLGHPQAQA